MIYNVYESLFFDWQPSERELNFAGTVDEPL